jgi:membrane protease YdiL (CAAX protease family)
LEFSLKKEACMNNGHQRQTLIFILFSYGISWCIWIPLVLNHRFGANIPSFPFQYYFAPYGPLMAGAITVLIASDKGAVRDYFKRVYRLPRKWLWYLCALGTPWIAFAVSALVKKALFGEFPGMEHFIIEESGLPKNLFIGWLLWIFSYGLGEEAGWRGFLLQHFHKRRSAFRSSLLTSMFWAGWHLPVFFFDENFRQMEGFGIVGWIIGLVSGSILLSWMTLNAEGSVIPAVLWHGTFNTVVAGTNADPFVSGLCSMLVVAAAIYLRLQFGTELKIKRKNYVFQSRR